MGRGSNDDVSPITKVKTPYKPKEELMAVVMEMSGGSRLKAMCEDGKRRMVRIRGTIKKENVGTPL